MSSTEKNPAKSELFHALWHASWVYVFIVNFEQISPFVLVFLLLTWSK